MNLTQQGWRRLRCSLFVLIVLLLSFGPSTLFAQDTSTAEPQVQITRNMNVRAGPSTGDPIIAFARPGEEYRITGRSSDGNWWRIDLNGDDAWIYAPSVQAINTAKVPVVTANQPGAPTSTPPLATPSPPVTSAASPVARFNPEQVQLRLEPIFTGLQQPTDVTNAGDGTGRIFVAEKSGRIRVFAGPEDASGQTFLDIVDRVGSEGYEQGLLGLAFPPNFRSTSYFFVNYTNKDGDTIIARYQVSRDNHNRADRDSEFVVLFQQQPAPNHNGGQLAFSPDGRLWIGLGDGGGANDTFQNGQNRGTLLGSMLRLDVTSNPSVPYRIPADNPFVGDDGTRDEIWAIGLRNPWRYSFDPRTGDLWIGDVGQSLFEEINFVSAAQARRGGLNFGWPISEGRHCAGDADCDLSAFILPIHEYGHAGNGCSVTGGRVYRGRAFPQLDGVYFFADFCSGNMWALWRTAGGVQTALVLPKAMSITAFGVDEAGELYVTDFGGGVYRLAVE
ncbi:MAG: PQQ-dependent sugar dehydrogenase [Caldilineaceae bacterium]|nr:PQQ-dependent sugar dehydrogenase [Caldilineaceae bacterium]